MLGTPLRCCVATVDTGLMWMTTISRWGPSMTLAVFTACAMAGCGGPDGAQRHSAQATYVHAADRICREANRLVGLDEARPQTFLELSGSIISTRMRFELETARLHALRSSLGDASSPQIDAFDHALNPFLRAVSALEQPATTQRRARDVARLRDLGTVVFNAAHAVPINACGRGGNAVADRAAFLNYKTEFLRLARRTRARLRPLAALPAGALTVSQLRRVTAIYRDTLRATRRLAPPRKLRKLDARFRRSLSSLLKTRDLIGRTAAGTRSQVLRTRLARQVASFQRADGRLAETFSPLSRVRQALDAVTG